MMTDDTTTPPAQASMSDGAREQLEAELVARVHAEGAGLVGPDGLLAEVAKRVLEIGATPRLAGRHERPRQPRPR